MRNRIIGNKDELNLYVEQLWDDGRRSYEDLRDAELELLTGMIMQKCNKSARWEYISETSKSDEIVNGLMQLFLEPDEEKKKELLEDLKTGATQYAKFRIDELFEHQAELGSYFERENILLAKQELAYAQTETTI